MSETGVSLGSRLCVFITSLQSICVPLFECRYENVQFLVVAFVHFFSANKCMY